MGFWDFFGTTKVIDTVADTVKSGVGMIDNAFFTDQEKAKAGLDYANAWLQIQLALAQENSLSSITRRMLAWTIMGVFLFLVLFACIVWKYDPEWSKYILQVLENTTIGWLVVAVGATYFVGYFGLRMKDKK